MKDTIDLSIVSQLVWNLLTLFLFYLFTQVLADSLNWPELLDFANWIEPIFLIFFSCWATYKLMLDNVLTMWTPYPSFLLYYSLYFGLGSLIYTFGNAESIACLDDFWPVKTYDLYRTNILNIVFLIIVIFASRIFNQQENFNILKSQLIKKKLSLTAIFLLAFLSYLIGSILQFSMVLPYTLRLPGSSFPSGMIIGIQLLCTQLGILLFCYLFFSKSNISMKFKIFILGAVAVELMTQLSTVILRRGAFLTLMIVILLGILLAKPRIKILVIGCLFIFVIYLIITPITNWGRNYGEELQQRGKGISVNIAALNDGFKSNGIYEESGSDLQKWWIRLNMNNVEAFIMNQYDLGYSDDSMNLAFWTLVPRFIYPDKPDISIVGAKFSILATGNDSNSVATTAPGDLYYNGGWMMVIFISILIGLSLATLTRLNLIIMSSSAFLFLPCILLGETIFHQIAGHFVSYLAGVVQYVIIFITVYFLFYKKSR